MQEQETLFEQVDKDVLSNEETCSTRVDKKNVDGEEDKNDYKVNGNLFIDSSNSVKSLPLS